MFVSIYVGSDYVGSDLYIFYVGSDLYIFSKFVNLETTMMKEYDHVLTRKTKLPSPQIISSLITAVNINLTLSILFNCCLLINYSIIKFQFCWKTKRSMILNILYRWNRVVQQDVRTEQWILQKSGERCQFKLVIVIYHSSLFCAYSEYILQLCSLHIINRKCITWGFE